MIEEWRRQIDQLDEQIVTLLDQRVEYSLKIGREKQQQGQPIYSPERETEVLQRVAAANQGPLDNRAVTRIFETILHESRRLQESSRKLP